MGLAPRPSRRSSGWRRAAYLPALKSGRSPSRELAELLRTVGPGAMLALEVVAEAIRDLPGSDCGLAWRARRLGDAWSADFVLCG